MNANTTVIMSDDIEDFFAGIMEGRSIRDAAWGAGLDAVQGVEILRSQETQQRIDWLSSAVEVALALPVTSADVAATAGSDAPQSASGFGDNVVPFRK